MRVEGTGTGTKLLDPDRGAGIAEQEDRLVGLLDRNLRLGGQLNAEPNARADDGEGALPVYADDVSNPLCIGIGKTRCIAYWDASGSIPSSYSIT